MVWRRLELCQYQIPTISNKNCWVKTDAVQNGPVDCKGMVYGMGRRSSLSPIVSLDNFALVFNYLAVGSIDVGQATGHLMGDPLPLENIARASDLRVRIVLGDGHYATLIVGVKIYIGLQEDVLVLSFRIKAVLNLS